MRSNDGSSARRRMGSNGSRSVLYAVPSTISSAMPQADGRRARRRIGHRQALAALTVLRDGRRDQRSEQGENSDNSAQHDRPLKQSHRTVSPIGDRNYHQTIKSVSKPLGVSSMSSRAPSSQRLEPLRRVDAGVLNIAYYEAGPVDGPVAMLLHGFPYDIHSYVDVAPIGSSRGRPAFVP